MKSKLELRQFAVTSALNLDDVTSETIISTAKAIEDYVLGGAELPETYDEVSLLDKYKDIFGQSALASSTYKPTTDEKVIEERAEEATTETSVTA